MHANYHSHEHSQVSSYNDQSALHPLSEYYIETSGQCKKGITSSGVHPLLPPSCSTDISAGSWGMMMTMMRFDCLIEDLSIMSSGLSEHNRTILAVLQ